MQKNEKFFIFSWKELVVIVLLMVTSLGFFFTLGLHYGKKLHSEAVQANSEAVDAKPEESPESLPPKSVLDEGAQHAEGAAQEAIKSATEEAVHQADLKVDAPRPVDLPKEKAQEKAPDEEAASSAAVSAKFGIQLGSYPNKKEAQLKIYMLTKRGLKPEIKTAIVNGEHRYRVVLTGFKTKQLAEAKAKDLRARRKIENFIIIKAE